MRNVVLLVAVVASLAVAPNAGAAIPSVFGGEVACTVQGDGVRFCGSSSPRSTVDAFDGVPLDVNVAFPPEPASGPDGGFPLVMIFHGYGGGKLGLSTMQRFLDRGFATFSMTDRGFRESCGSIASRAADPTGCAAGYVRLIDTRYEVRDAQEFAGRLADEGLIDPQAIGATGGSYGGGVSMALAALRDRKALPDGSLVPWTSPGGTPMRIAAAAPLITWSDLAYSLTPNGSTLDYVVDSPYTGRVGVIKESLVNGLYLSGLGAPGYYASPGTDSSADLTTWRNHLFAGEPYDGDPQAQAILDEITANHSSYYIDDSTPPAPLLMANGFTDDLFPVDEMVRFYNRTRAEHPQVPLSLFAAEISGHPRSPSKPDAQALLGERVEAWFDHYLKGVGPVPITGVEVLTQSCPASAPFGARYRAPNWAKIAPGEIRFSSRDARTIAPGAGDAASANAFNPVGGGGSCVQVPADEGPGTASYLLKAAPAAGFTTIGSPTVIADFKLPGNTSQVAARLLDVAPDGNETLVARGLWRPARGGPRRQVFQLHPAAWEFASGHIPKLELLPKDGTGSAGLGSYGRVSNNQKPVGVSDLELRLPVRERPGTLNGRVKAPRAKFVPRGYRLHPDFRRFGKPRAPQLGKGPYRIGSGTLIVPVRCPKVWAACNRGRVLVKAAKRETARFRVARGRFAARGGQGRRLSLPLTARARRYFARNDRLRVKVTITSAESPGRAFNFKSARD